MLTPPRLSLRLAPYPRAQQSSTAQPGRPPQLPNRRVAAACAKSRQPPPPLPHKLLPHNKLPQQQHGATSEGKATGTVKTDDLTHGKGHQQHGACSEAKAARHQRYECLDKHVRGHGLGTGEGASQGGMKGVMSRGATPEERGGEGGRERGREGAASEREREREVGRAETVCCVRSIWHNRQGAGVPKPACWRNSRRRAWHTLWTQATDSTHHDHLR